MRAVAIVGMGCRFAGAPDLHAYWTLLRQGRNAFGPVPADRWDAELFTSTSGRDFDRTTAPAGAFIDDIRSFPALALGIPPRRVEVMDPQQRFTIETALQAIEDAGYAPGTMPHRTGVYVGLTATEYRVLSATRVMTMMMASGQLGRAPDDVEALVGAIENVIAPRPFSAPGVLGNMSAAAVAQELDLHGPAYTVDAACASAMVALNDAVAQLRAGHVDAALAGGAYLQITPEHYIAFSRIGAMSNEGVCRPFDARADGFVQGDGVGMLLLKRLEDAERDGDRIYAVIEGVAVNNDGRGDGPMAPRTEGQLEVMQAAWADAGIDPTRISHVETHGTGTVVGDAAELLGLQGIFGGAHRVALGSSKANVGHTMSTAGIAGLIKAALSIHHATLPPLANFETAKQDVGLEGGPFWVPTSPTPWDDPDRLTGISSFGFGGTNGHAILRAAATVAAPRAQHELVVMSAPDAATLADLAARTADAIEADVHISVAGVARAWATRRPQPARAAIVAQDRATLVASLRALATGTGAPEGLHQGHATEDAPRVAFLFPGQGAQRTGMLQELATRFPRIQETLSALETALQDDLALPLTHLMWPDRRTAPVPDVQATEELTATEHCQPAMHAAGIALARLLADVGIHPAVVTGHSLGEFTAAAVAGVWTAEDAARFVTRRGQAMAALTGDTGTMAAVMAPADEVQAWLVDGAVIANINHPRQTVISGLADAVDASCARAAAAGVDVRPLTVSHAFHSPVLAGLDSAPLLQGVALADPDVPLASAIRGRTVRDAQDARQIFTDHATSPVQFVQALGACQDAGADLYLQVGAGGPLASFARGVIRGSRGVFTLASRDDHDGGVGLLHTLGQLWCAGVDLDVRPITAPAPVASVPPAVLPRETYWVVQDKPARRMTMPGVVARARPAPEAAPAAPAAPPPPPTDAKPADDAVEGVMAVIAKVSAYPRAALKPTMKLMEDLGFDSLMLGDLATGLSERFPGLPGIPQELWINSPTVDVLIDFVRTGAVVDETIDDEAPLHAWQPTWVPTPWPDLPGAALPTGRIVVTGSDVAEAHEVATGLTAAGMPAEAMPAPQAAAERDVAGLVWVGPTAPPRPVAHTQRADVPWPDQAGALLAVLGPHAQRGATPDVIALSRHDDPWAAGLQGALRSVAREWPSARVLHLGTDDLQGAVASLPRAWASAETTTDLRFVRGVRHTLGFTPVASEGEALSADDVVVITGGTRGIGLALGVRLAAEVRQVVLVGRRAPSEEDQALLAAFGDRIVVVLADVLDHDALQAALSPCRPTALVHAAGMLADGALGAVDAATGHAARDVKVRGWLHALDACGPTLQRAVGIGSWAGRFGNRHQAHYAAANALLAELALHAPEGVIASVGEFGPWLGTDMAETIPAPVRQAMRAEGVDFVGRDAGLDALVADLTGTGGIRVHGRRVPDTARALRVPVHLSTTHDPYLRDHAIDGLPILPLAAVTDLFGWAADRSVPFEVRDVTLFAGVTVREPQDLVVHVQGDRASLRHQDGRLHDTARVGPVTDLVIPGAPQGGAAPTLSLQAFYDDVTFHGPLLQGLRSIDAVGDTFVTGTVVAGRPTDWTPDTPRQGFAVDPLVLDSVMQLAAYVAWVRYQRAGTPVSLGRVAVLAHLEPGRTYRAEAHFEDATEDRFAATLVVRDGDTAVLVAHDVVAELRKVDRPEAWSAPAEATDVSLWPEVHDLAMRLEGVKAMGLQNPYFHVHQGTARDTTVVDGRELINFSSYNYIGLSGDPRVLARVHEAADRYGTSVSASRVASGERPFHGELEALLARSQGCEDALLFTAGHATNVTTVGHLMGPEDLILHDAYIHDSILQGIKLSGASRRSFRHEDPDHLAEQLQALRPNFRRCLIIVEGVYSMDGDICQLPRYVALKKQHGALLMVDEAHSFGIVGATGCGVAEHWGIPGSEVDVWMGTLSKSLASCGGWIAGSKALITYLKYTAPGFVYSAGLTPANGVAALASLQLMLEEPERVQRLQANARIFHDACQAHGLDNGPARGGSGVVPVITGNSMHALVLSQRLLAQGINVQPIVYPAVPDDAARLRFFLSSTHSEAQLRHTAAAVAATLAQVRTEMPLP